MHSIEKNLVHLCAKDSSVGRGPGLILSSIWPGGGAISFGCQSNELYMMFACVYFSILTAMSHIFLHTFIARCFLGLSEINLLFN